MTVRLVWSEQAVEDLAEIHAYIARNSPRYADVVAGRLLAALSRLADHPDSGRMVPELEDPAVREVIHGTYRLVYERHADAVEILTVFRASRLLPPLDRA